jgi:hypothetical protein
MIAVGLAILLIGYFGVSGTVYPAQQLPYIISGGVGGLFALAIGCMLWLSADLRDEWRKLDRIEMAIMNGDRSDLTGRGTTSTGEHGEGLFASTDRSTSLGAAQSDHEGSGAPLS